MKTADQFLDSLNTSYAKIHTAYEKLFWISYMGDHSVDKKMNEAQTIRDAFRSDVKLAARVDEYLKDKSSTKSAKTKARLLIWKNFFSLYQTPKEVLGIKKRVRHLEAVIEKKRSSQKQGYIDPKTGQFVEASENKMRTIMRTHPDEAVRKAVFDSMQKLPLAFLDEYVEVIKLRNEYARAVGHEDFYAYKLAVDERRKKAELFSIFDKIYEKTKFAFGDIRELEKTMPGLRKPWNFGYMMVGDFTYEEDPYFQFSEALEYWGRSFDALGVDFQGSTVTLDLIDRKGKYNNGFCHAPDLVQYVKKNGKEVRLPGSTGFTCTAIPGQVGSGMQGIQTLFHEGGHAAHHLNSTQREVCLNHEYPPMSVSWAETQSIFMDSISSSIEWRTRYAKNAAGKKYPFDLFERKLRKVHVLRPLGMMGISMVVAYEKEIYEHKNLNRETVLEIARKIYKKYNDYSEDSISILNIPHIYSWESSAYYHGYGLAELGVNQWREYFFKKYGYIVDNPRVGKEMTKAWSYAALYSPQENVKKATGKPLSPNAFIAEVTMPLEKIIDRAKARIKRLETMKHHSGKVDLNANIRLVHGKKLIADNKKGFEKMVEKYKKWLDTIERQSKN